MQNTPAALLCWQLKSDETTRLKSTTVAQPLLAAAPTLLSAHAEQGSPGVPTLAAAARRDIAHS
jgi:hypothetical protein